MPEYVTDRVAEALNRTKKSVNGARILVVGVSYKSDIDDIRESPSLDVIELLRRRGAHVMYHDELADASSPELSEIEALKLTRENISSCDCVAILTAHSDIDYKLVLEHSAVIVDARNVYAGDRSDKIVRL